MFGDLFRRDMGDGEDGDHGNVEFNYRGRGYDRHNMYDRYGDRYSWNSQGDDEWGWENGRENDDTDPGTRYSSNWGNQGGG